MMPNARAETLLSAAHIALGSILGTLVRFYINYVFVSGGPAVQLTTRYAVLFFVLFRCESVQPNNRSRSREQHGTHLQ
jgi:hypothetical protein